MRNPLAPVYRDGCLRRLSTSFTSFVSDDGGQDIIEYAFLAAFIGIAGWAALSIIDDAVETTYRSYLDPASGVPALWEPAEPVGSGP
jgi:Flp pilus assembly pilin Flp